MIGDLAGNTGRARGFLGRKIEVDLPAVRHDQTRPFDSSAALAVFGGGFVIADQPGTLGNEEGATVGAVVHRLR